MYLIGIDDTDIVGTKGTNYLAKAIVSELSSDWACKRIVRHQLLVDPRIACTRRNGCVSILIEPRIGEVVSEESELLLVHKIRETMKAWYVKGSDPGLCVCRLDQIDSRIVQFGYRCQFEMVRQSEALSLADETGVHLEGLGGSNAGLIGALAAVGLGYNGNDGRVVQIGDWSEELTGRQSIVNIQSRGIQVTNIDTDESLSDGFVELDQKLRPNLRDNRIVLFVQKFSGGNEEPTYHAVRLP